MCRRATYGYDQRVEFFGTEGLVKHENHFPSAVQKWTGQAVQQADLPHNFFMTRYADAYKNETRVSIEIYQEVFVRELISGGSVVYVRR